MQEAKNTARALVRIGFDGRVHKYFKGPQAGERYANELRVLRYLEQKGCAFVPHLISSDDAKLYLVTSNAGQRVEHVSAAKCEQMFAQLERYGVRHEDAELRNITYNEQQGQFNIIDFEYATILEPGYPPSPEMKSVADRGQWQEPPTSTERR
ncbi:MAG: serine/threonine protein phosphatase [Opitutales bacterium]|jgi:tRNA A-37 threonylcarbamoyl transferase component Bud32